MATGTSGMSETAVRSTEIHSRTEIAAIKLAEVCRQMDAEAARYTEAVREAESLISQLENPKHIQVLTLRYIEDKTWKQIYTEMGYTDIKSAYRVHGWALAAADSIYRRECKLADPKAGA